jgi:tRNA (guanine26-N2/guanine27-N2)-dimethyltransferase
MLDHSAPEQRFDIVDLDPYGSASPFLDIGVQCVADGGLMCVTCTDMAVLCGAHSESCFSKYGSVAIKSKACHEEALRIVLHTVEAAASRHKRAITPLLSVHMDFYVRVFVRVHISPKDTKLSMSKTGMIYQVIYSCSSDQFPAQHDFFTSV